MNSTQFDLLAFEYLGKLTPFEPERTPRLEIAELKGDGIEPIGDLGEVQSFGISGRAANGKVNCEYKDVNGRLIGLNVSNYRHFADFLSEGLMLPHFEGKCNLDFLLENAFNWLIETYERKQTGQSLSSYLLDRIENETKPYTFYFRLAGIAIQTNIRIGTANIVYVSNEEVQRHIATACADMPDCEQLIANRYQSEMKGINVKIVVNSIYEIAKTRAIRQAELAVDVLKCFLVNYSYDKIHIIPELKHRSTSNRQREYWVFWSDFAPASPNIERLEGILPLRIDNDFITLAKHKGLSMFDAFIRNQHDDDLYLEIVENIKRFSEIVSTSSNHEKVQKAITLLESAILPRPGVGRGNGQKKLKNYVLPKLIESDLDLAKSTIGRCYNVRDAFLHNCQELPLDVQTLTVMMEIVRIFIIKLMFLHSQGKREFSDIGLFFDCM